MTSEEFINKAKQIHGNKYDYSKVHYVNNHTKICIICPIHGEFEQMPYHHLRGSGCSTCARQKQTLTKDEFVERANKIHNNKYNYSKVEYINSDTKICIICPEHGEFWQTPYNHLMGKGCKKCGDIAGWNKRGRVNNNDFIEKAIKIHGDKYIYDKVEYVNNHTKVCITCPEHGDFWQIPNDHLDGKGCYYCGLKSQTDKRRLPVTDFINRANEVHNNKYDYSKVEYINAQTKVRIICPHHGEFWQTPYSHLQGCGCPMCANNGTSSVEVEIKDYIQNTLGIEIVERDRKLLDGLESDIIVPSKKLAIEYNGLYWHSETQGKDKNYHLHKTELAESKGYHLIHIFEDEWLEHKKLVLNKIRHFLGKDLDKTVIGARKCTIKTVSKDEAEPFLTTYHIQGFVLSTAYYGAFYEDKLVGVMTFKQEKKGEWNLTRFATDTSYRLPGLANKIFRQFLKDCEPIEVKTFLDRRWSHGDVNVYDRMEFRLEDILPPDYRYIVRNQRLHKFGFRKQILAKRYDLPLTMTEREMTEQLGFHRIWDCGLYKYVWDQH